MNVILTLRDAIIMRVKDNNQAELKDVIQGSIGGDEKALPGIGVLFELIWPNLTEAERDRLASVLHEQVAKQGTAAAAPPAK
ncbi:small acid-soluble spore protein SspI [Paenibacillus sp. GCM10023252]|uniref:small acid-soluble spore protein SspI n=1 Tax=Paenibacillus sp. GCM10023252 TaxID=3252649 RepID=UPI0036213A49